MLRNPNSIPATDTIIADPVMEPFFITRSPNNGYTVYERVVKGENNTEYIKTVCYPSNFNYAIKKAAEEISPGISIEQLFKVLPPVINTLFFPEVLELYFIFAPKYFNKFSEWSLEV